MARPPSISGDLASRADGPSATVAASSSCAARRARVRAPVAGATLAAAALGAAWSAPALAPVSPAVCDALGVTRRLPTGGVALTFDDGPHAQGTPAVLEALAAAGATATFFLVGEQVERRPALAAEIV